MTVIGFLSNTGPDPLKIHATNPAYNDRPSSARQRMVCRWWPTFSCIWIFLPSSTNKKKEKRCQSCRVGPPLIKLSGSGHETWFCFAYDSLTLLLHCYKTFLHPPPLPDPLGIRACHTWYWYLMHIIAKNKSHRVIILEHDFNFYGRIMTLEQVC